MDRVAFRRKVARTPDQMTPSEWAVLALLAEGPTHGFAVARAMADDGDIGRVWSLRRPRVYYAIEVLTRLGFARAAETMPSRSGPARTVLRITPSGRRAVTGWLATPVEHVRDARSLLLLKLLFLNRRQIDPGPLLVAQRAHFDSIVERLQGSVDGAHGFDATLLRWRIETAGAAVRFIDAVIDGSSNPTAAAGAAGND